MRMLAGVLVCEQGIPHMPYSIFTLPVLFQRQSLVCSCLSATFVCERWTLATGVWCVCFLFVDIKRINTERTRNEHGTNTTPPRNKHDDTITARARNDVSTNERTLNEPADCCTNTYSSACMNAPSSVWPPEAGWSAAETLAQMTDCAFGSRASSPRALS